MDDVAVPSVFSRFWRSVISIREYLRTKRQSFSTSSTITLNRASSMVTVLPHRSSSELPHTDSLDSVRTKHIPTPHTSSKRESRRED